MREDYSVEGTAPADLGQLAGRHVGAGVGVGLRSLEGLAATMLQRRLSKDGVRMSDWEGTLSSEQV